jgi:hypothetical protein
MKKLTYTLFCLLFGCLFIGCDQTEEAVTPQAELPVIALGNQDEILATIADQAPTFGGYYHDVNNGLQLVIWLKNESEKAKIASLLLQKAEENVLGFKNIEELKSLSFKVAPALYNFRELKNVADKVLLVKIPNAIWLDIDETQNKVVIAVTPKDDGYVKDILLRANIPLEAIEVKTNQEIYRAA